MVPPYSESTLALLYGSRGAGSVYNARKVNSAKLIQGGQNADFGLIDKECPKFRLHWLE